MAGPDVAAKSKLDPQAFFGMIDQVVKQHSRTSSWSRRRSAKCTRPTGTTGARSRGSSGKTYVTPTCQLDVFDRIGGGDGFAVGLIYGLLTGEAPEERVRLGWAHGALLTTFPGDTTMARSRGRGFAKGGSARVQR